MCKMNIKYILNDYQINKISMKVNTAGCGKEFNEVHAKHI